MFFYVEPFSLWLFHQHAISAVLNHFCLYKLRKRLHIFYYFGTKHVVL